MNLILIASAKNGCNPESWSNTHATASAVRGVIVRRPRPAQAAVPR
jgi:hypothetical protein